MFTQLMNDSLEPTHMKLITSQNTLESRVETDVQHLLMKPINVVDSVWMEKKVMRQIDSTAANEYVKHLRFCFIALTRT